MPLFLIPARNSRHRIACFALYRNLLQQATRIHLPEDLATAWGPRNPIKHLVRRTFRRNSSDTSPRLVYPALKAGYRILALLHAASTYTPPTKRPRANAKPKPTGNPEYDSVIEYLRTRLEERNRSLAAKELHPPNSRNPPKPSSAPRPDTVPLFVNVTPAPTPMNPHPKPVYATPSRPRPLSELGGSGRRKIPHIDMASDYPFLRIKKPQPAVLSRVLNQKIKTRLQRTDTLREVFEEMMPEAEQEDEWERIVQGMYIEQARERRNNALGEYDRNSDPPFIDDATARREARIIEEDFRAGNTFRQTVFEHGNIYVQNQLNAERDDLVARADAMRRLIEEEKRLLVEEREQRAREKRRRWEEKMKEVEGDEWTKKILEKAR
ncbi:uncharacterized protein GGS25DRAFT_520684 [Hypoxylon fragiforme]|uniref:uncharacterized protein n=1 Tax=Hypoxylon fragiforme TaxID=63214 RepID=UPI0020C5EA80|nr:uncharacterized protein GGS25DRAFT_520684 [Hypoxylon fragiforme]KAI2609879.1 hypothetical protein GGS25DRAFT_520684 [Hypoxylon fragiforme]